MQLKDNFKYIFEIYKQSLNNQKFMLTFLLSIVFSVYGVLQLAFNFDYVSGFLTILSGGIYIAGLLLIILINTCNVYDLFEENQFYIIRFSSKKQYLKELIKTIVFSNFCTIIINILFIMIGLNMLNSNDIVLSVKEYGVSSIVYLIFSIIKLFVLSGIIAIFNILLLKLINKKVIVVLNIIFYIIIAGASYSPNIVISSITQMPWFIGTYFLGYLYMYNSFILEVLCFCFYVAILLIGMQILNYFVLKYMKEVTK